MTQTKRLLKRIKYLEQQLIRLPKHKAVIADELSKTKSLYLAVAKKMACFEKEIKKQVMDGLITGSEGADRIELAEYIDD